MTTTAQDALRLIVSATLEAVAAAGPTGAPAGALYAALATQGATLSQFESLMGALVRAGRITQQGHLYFVA
jgi:hypothetical protein